MCSLQRNAPTHPHLQSELSPLPTVRLQPNYPPASSGVNSMSVQPMERRLRMAVTTASVTCHRGSTPGGGQHQRERVWGWLCGRHGCGAPPWSTAGAEGFKQQVAACNQPSARSSRSTQHNQPSIGRNRQQAAGSRLRAAAGPVLEADASQAASSRCRAQAALGRASCAACASYGSLCG